MLTIYFNNERRKEHKRGIPRCDTVALDDLHPIAFVEEGRIGGEKIHDLHVLSQRLLRAEVRHLHLLASTAGDIERQFALLTDEQHHRIQTRLEDYLALSR